MNIDIFNQVPNTSRKQNRSQNGLYSYVRISFQNDLRHPQLKNCSNSLFDKCSWHKYWAFSNRIGNLHDNSRFVICTYMSNCSCTLRCHFRSISISFHPKDRGSYWRFFCLFFLALEVDHILTWREFLKELYR